MTEKQSLIKDVFHIRELPNGGKCLYTKIGSAFLNKDGSINVFIDSLPIDGRMHIRDRKEKEAK